MDNYFVPAVSGHVSLGRPFPDAVNRVASEVDLEALQPDVEALAYNLRLTTGPAEEADVRAAALERFVDRLSYFISIHHSPVSSNGNISAL